MSNHGFTVGRRWLLRTLVLFSMLMILFPAFAIPVSADPSITRNIVKSTNGEPGDKVLFLVTYKSTENLPPAYVQLIFDDKVHEMSPENEQDMNYSNGKDYLVRLRVYEGVHLYHFKVSDGNMTFSSLASVMVVKPTNEFTHLDVTYGLLLATFILLVPIIYGLHLIRRIANNMDKPAGKKGSSDKDESRVKKKSSSKGKQDD